MSDSVSEDDRFADLVQDRSIESKFDRDGRIFLPRGDDGLDGLLTPENIDAELKVDVEKSEPAKQITEDEVRAVKAYIRRDANLVFAIVANIIAQDGVPLVVMKHLMDANFNDKCLPIEPRSADQPHVLSNIKWWNQKKGRRIDKFCWGQWQFLAPVFSVEGGGSSMNQAFRTSCIMPFTKRYDDNADANEGAFGQVTKFTIHPSHLIDPSRP
ncbi:hypothetical protein V8F06_014655, partial [Rhypophila decipiens]